MTRPLGQELNCMQKSRLLQKSHMQWQWTSKIILLDDDAMAGELNGCGCQLGQVVAHVL
jgi:hypothetical protein